MREGMGFFQPCREGERIRPTLGLIRGGSDRRVLRAGDPAGGEPLPHGPLVLGEPERGRAGPDCRGGPGQPGQRRGGHLLVVERDHVAAGREGGQVIRAAVVADPGALADQGGAVGRAGGQDPEPDAQAGRRLAGHPGQLARADHADHGYRPARRGGRLRRRRGGDLGLITHAP